MQNRTGLSVALATLIAALPALADEPPASHPSPEAAAAANDRRPEAETHAAAPKRLENVTRDEAYALFHSLENVRRTVRHRTGIGAKAVNATIRYVSGDTMESERGWTLPVRVETTFHLLGNQFETVKVFLFEWDAQNQVLTAEVDQPRVTTGRFNMRVSNTTGGILGRFRALEALRSGGMPSGNAAINAQTRTVFLQNLPMTISPHIYLNREGAGGLIKAWAGVRFDSRVETTGVAVPGVQRGVTLDVEATPDAANVGANRTQEGFDARADVQVEGVIYATFTYEEKFVRRQASFGERLMSRLRTTPSPLNLEVRPRFHYQIRSGATVLQGGSHGHTQRYTPLRAAPLHAPRVRAANWGMPRARVAARTNAQPVRVRSAGTARSSR